MTTSTLPASGRTTVAASMILLLTFGWTLIGIPAVFAGETTETIESAEGQDPVDDEAPDPTDTTEADPNEPDATATTETDATDEEATPSDDGSATADAEVDTAEAEEATEDAADDPDDGNEAESVEEASFAAQSEHEDPAELQAAEFTDAGDEQTFGNDEGDTLTLTFDGELSGVAEDADGQVTVSGADGDDINLQQSEALDFAVDGATLTLTVTAPGNVTDVDDILDRVVTIVDEVYDTNDVEVVVPEEGIEIVARDTDGTDDSDEPDDTDDTDSEELIALRGELEDRVRELFGDDVAGTLSETIASLETSEDVLQDLLDAPDDDLAGFVSQLLDAGYDGLVEELVVVLVEAGAIDELVEILTEVLDAGLVAELLPVLDELVEQLIDTEAFDDLRLFVEALLDAELVDEVLDVLLLAEEHEVLAELEELFPRIFTALIEAGMFDELTVLLVSIADADIDLDVVVILDGLLADLEGSLESGDITEDDARRFLQGLLEDELLGTELERRVADGELSVVLTGLLDVDTDTDTPDTDTPDTDTPDTDTPDTDTPDTDTPSTDGPDDDSATRDLRVVTRSPDSTTGAVTSGTSAPGTLAHTGATTTDLVLGGLLALLFGGVALRMRPRPAQADLDG